jgi:hypothetical protein
MKPLKSAGDFKQVPEGPHPAILYSLIDLGTQEGTYQGKPAKPKRKIAMRFELHGDEAKMDDGRPMSIGKTFTLSSSSKGNLRPFMEGWRGKAFTDEEFEAFDLRNMIGKPAIITIVEDGEYRVINGISRLMSGMTAPEQSNKSVYLSLDPAEFDEMTFTGLHEKTKETIRQSPEWKTLNGIALPAAAPATSTAAPFDDEIPF